MQADYWITGIVLKNRTVLTLGSKPGRGKAILCRECAGDGGGGGRGRRGGIRMLPAQLKMRMCNLGIVFWTIVGNRNMNGPMRTHNARNTALCISVQTRGPNKGTKQTSGHDCLLFKGTTDHSAQGVWDSRTHRRSHLEWLFLFQRPGSQRRTGLPEIALSMFDTEQYFSASHPPSYSPNLAPVDTYCFQSPNLSHKGQRHVIWNSLKMCYRLERIHQKEGVKVFWVTLGMYQQGMRCWCFCCPVWGAVREQGRVGCGMSGLWEGTASHGLDARAHGAPCSLEQREETGHKH